VVGYRLRGSGDVMPKQRSAAELEGIDELQQTLKNMEPHLRKRALRPSLKKSAQTIVLPAARSNLQLEDIRAVRVPVTCQHNHSLGPHCLITQCEYSNKRFDQFESGYHHLLPPRNSNLQTRR
jgi:hypothetical protein